VHGTHGASSSFFGARRGPRLRGVCEQESRDQEPSPALRLLGGAPAVAPAAPVAAVAPAALAAAPKAASEACGTE